jgi:uncharacterized protein (TIGR03435 family)
MRSRTLSPAGIAAIVLGLLAAALSAQAPAENPTFEVASVKQNKSGENRVMIQMQPGGRLNATNVTLRQLIRFAYGIQDFQMIGGPDWIDSEHFDVIGKAEGDPQPSLPGTQGPVQKMMAALLKDRFKLATHNETREQPTYALVLARGDGKLGAGLMQSTTDCAALVRNRANQPPPPIGPGQRPMCGIMIGPGRMGGGGFPLSQLAMTLSQTVRRPVVDKTGLSGMWDFELTFAPDLQQGPPGSPPALLNGGPVDPNAPSIFTAVQEQLGLKLDSQRGFVDVTVIDSASLPTPD